MSEEIVEQQEIRKRLTDLVGALFDSSIPFYDKGDMQAAIFDFAKDKEVLRAAREFTVKLESIWKARFPDKPLKHADPKNKYSKWNAPDFSSSKEEESCSASDKGQAGATVPMPAAPEGTSSAPASENATLVQNLKEASPTLSTTLLKPGQSPCKTMPTPKQPESRPPTFRLPNCRVGTPYAGKIEGDDANGKPVLVIEIRIPEVLGLSFDPKTQIVSGEPKADGEFNLDLLWAYQDVVGKTSGACLLISNPDPRSLWKVVEPQGLPYPKPHLDKKLIENNGFNIAAASRRGRSHEHGGTFRDDDFFVTDDPAKGWSVLIVADGAGSAKSSREGSRLAVAAAGEHMKSHLTGEFGDKMASLLTT
jgi:hypothetical protein